MARRWARYFVIGVALLGSSGAFVTGAHARAGDLVGLLGGASVDDATAQINAMIHTNLKEFLAQADADAKDLLDKGMNDGSLLEIQASNSMINLTATIRSGLSNEMDRQVASVAIRMMPIFVQLQRWRSSLDKLSDKLVGLEDLIALDALNLPFADDALFIRRIYGGVLVQNHPETYYIDLFGQHFGGDTGDITTSFRVSLSGKALTSAEPVPPNDAVFSIPAKEVEGLFERDKIAKLPLDIVVTRRTSPRWYSGIFPDFQTVHLPYTVSLLPENIGILTVANKYIHFDWQSLQPIVPQITVVTGPTNLGPYEAPNPVKLGVAEDGSGKIDPKSIAVACMSDMQDARDFGNGRILPANHDVFSHGFRSPDSCGSKGDRDAAIASIKQRFKFLFNVDVPLNCGEGQYPVLHGPDLIKASKPVKLDVSGCRDMQADPDLQWEPDGVGFRVRLTGTPLNPVSTFFDPSHPVVGTAKWKVTYQLLTYKPTAAIDSDPDQIKSIVKSTPVEFFVADHLGQNAATLTFAPRIGPPLLGSVGLDLGALKVVGPPAKLIDRTQYRYEFRYPQLNLNSLRALDGLNTR